MRNCFICGKEYDEANRTTVTYIHNRYSGEQLPTRVVSGKDGKYFMLCPTCTKTAVIFGCIGANGRFVTSEKLYYEDGSFEEC